MKKTKKISQKVLQVLLGVSMVSLLVCCVIAYVTMDAIRDDTHRKNSELGAKAAGYSEEALSEQAKYNLFVKASDRADLINETISDCERFTEIAAGFISELYSTPDAFGDYPVTDMNAEKTGGLTLQYAYPTLNQEYMASISEELFTIGNAAYVFDPIMRLDYSLAAIQFASESGIYISYNAYPSNYSGIFDARKRDWYIGAQKNGTYWSDIYLDWFVGIPIVTQSRACYDSNGNFIGVVGIDILLDDFEKIINDTQISENGHVLLVNDAGECMASTLSVHDDTNKISAAIPKEGEGLITIEHNGEEAFLAYFELLRADWCIGLTMPVADVIAPAEQIREKIITRTDEAVAGMDSYIMTTIYAFEAVLVIAIIVISFFSIRFSKRITGPILTLTNGVKEISGGNLDYHITVDTGDEIESLAEAYNKMTCDIKEHIESVSKMTAEKERIETELNVAAAIQASMLPADFELSADKSFEAYGLMKPAREVGGDFYDLFLIDDSHVCAIIADVSGKGVAAALFMVVAKTIIKERALSGCEPHKVFYQANNHLCEGNTSNMFVTAFMAVLNFKTGSLKYVNAGHNPPYIFGKKGCRRLDVKRSLTLAVMEDYNFETLETVLEAGEALLLYTDGVTEAMNSSDELYSEERLVKQLNTCPASGLKEVLLRIRGDITAFEGGVEQTDDITILMLKYNGQL